MNRKILFRGKRINNGEWVEGYYVVYPDGKETISRKCDSPPDGDPMWKKILIEYEVDSNTVCQYTELTDKNGRKIFEGDICKDGENIVRILWNDKHQWGVKISKTDNVLSKGLIFPLWQYDNCKENGNRQLEIIGNIFDNPELLD